MWSWEAGGGGESTGFCLRHARARSAALGADGFLCRKGRKGEMAEPGLFRLELRVALAWAEAGG